MQRQKSQLPDNQLVFSFFPILLLRFTPEINVVLQTVP